jgi:DNA invertase Pin-like site-specific DNA recombinase
MRVSTDQQDLTAQRDGLTALDVAANRVYVEQGLTGTNRERPGLREALAACREGDTLMVTKLDRLARSLPDARAIAGELTMRLVLLRTREGMKVARAKGRLRGRQPKLNHAQEAHPVALFDGGDHSTAELADLFGVTGSTVYRALERQRARVGAGLAYG